MADEKLRIELTADDRTSSAFQLLRSNAQMVQKAMDALNGAAAGASRGGLADMANALGVLRTMALPAAIITGIVALGVAGYDAYKKLLELGKAADDLGLRASQIDAFGRALKGAGGSADNAVKALRNLREEMERIKGDRVTSLKDLFEINSRPLTDAAGQLLPLQDVMRGVAELVRNAAHETDRLAIATLAMGSEAAPAFVKAVMENSRALNDFIGAARDAEQPLDVIVKTAREAEGSWGAWLTVIRNVTEALRKAAASQPNLPGTANDPLFNSLRERNAAETAALGVGQQTQAPVQDDLFGSLRSINNMARARGLDPFTKVRKKAEDTTRREDRTDQALEFLEQERRKLTFNLDIRSDAERVEMQIQMIRRAGADATADEKNQIRASVDLLFQKKTEFDVLKRAVEGYNDALRMGGDMLVSAVDGLINKTKTWKDVLADSLRMLEQALLKAAIMGEGPLAGITGTKSRDGGVGGLLGGLFGGLLRPAMGGAIANPFAGGALVPTFHSGGIVGTDSAALRLLDPAALIGAPRFHSGGILPGESAVIAKDGEEIGWPEQLARKYGGGPVSIAVNIDLTGANGDETIRRIAFQAAAEGSRRALAQVPGLATAAVGKRRADSPGYLRK